MKKFIWAAVLLLVFSLAGCGSSSGGFAGSSKVPDVMAGEDGIYTGTIDIKENITGDSEVYTDGVSVIDASNKNDGYVMVKTAPTQSRLKVQVIKGDVKYNYDLNKNGEYEAFPLQLGAGQYNIRIMQNSEGNKYFEIFSAAVDFAPENENAPFLSPNQYSNYNSSSAVVKKSYDLCYYAQSDTEKLIVIYKWITDNISYDKEKAETVQSGYLPNPDEILSIKKGICFDYASVMAAMLRAQGIPTKLVVGTVSKGDINHAWNEVYLEGQGWVTVKIYFDGNQWQMMDPTFDSSGSALSKYIGDGTFYTTLRIY